MTLIFAYHSNGCLWKNMKTIEKCDTRETESAYGSLSGHETDQTVYFAFECLLKR